MRAALVASAAASAAAAAPEQVHLALAGPGAMNVGWYTADAASSVVEYGASDSLGSTVGGASTQYLSGYGYHHSATVTGLSPGAQYYYSVGDNATRSAVYRFATPGGADSSVSVNIFGDMGWLGSKERPMTIATSGLVKEWSADPSRVTMERLKDEGAIDFVWHVGDIAYADDAFAHKGCTLGFCYEDTYNGFMNWIQNVSAVMPYMVTVGNHESECHDVPCITGGKGKSLGNFTAYNQRWHMPSAASGGRASMWYSFDYGPVHFVGINTETDFAGAGEEEKGDGGFTACGHFGADGEYIAWLEKDLQQAQAGGRWIIAGGHRPWHENLGGAKALMEKYGVKIYFAGHGHSYARGASDAGVATVMVGGAGCDEKNDLESDTVSQLAWAHARSTGGYSTDITSTGVLKASPTQLDWQLIEGSTQKVLDSITITK